MNETENFEKIRQWAHGNISLIIEGLNTMDQALFGERERQIYAEVFGTAHLEFVKMNQRPDYIPTVDTINYLRDKKTQLTDFIWNKTHEIY